MARSWPSLQEVLPRESEQVEAVLVIRAVNGGLCA